LKFLFHFAKPASTNFYQWLLLINDCIVKDNCTFFHHTVIFLLTYFISFMYHRPQLDVRGVIFTHSLFILTM